MLKPFHANGVPGWPFNELERLLQLAASSGGRGAPDPGAHAAFWNELLTGDLYILGSVDDRGRASLPSYGLPGGDALVVFTSRELLEHSIAAQVEFITMPAKSFFEMTKGARVALNPCGPYGKEFTAEEISHAMGGFVSAGGRQMQATRDTQVLLGQLAVEPVELIKAVEGVCRNAPSINAARLCAVSMPSTGDARAHPLIGLDAKSYVMARDAVGPVVESWSKGAGLPVDVVDLNAGGALADHLQSSGRVIYKRKTGWLAGLLG
ncbi:MAG: enhanced serine sensitivity protein SseB C-terminal domain-containing protein [Phycisphaerales bacterium]